MTRLQAIIKKQEIKSFRKFRDTGTHENTTQYHESALKGKPEQINSTYERKIKKTEVRRPSNWKSSII